jgi:hypothetical protein
MFKNQKKQEFHNITKIEAAKRQLETAIILFLCEKDPVSTHTLANASIAILKDLAKNKGIKSLITDLSPIFENSKLNQKQQERINAWAHKEINKCYNFFKHGSIGNKNNNEILFSPQRNQFYIFEAVRFYTLLELELTETIKLFYIYFINNNLDILELTNMVPSIEIVLNIDTEKIVDALPIKMLDKEEIIGEAIKIGYLLFTKQHLTSTEIFEKLKKRAEEIEQKKAQEKKTKVTNENKIKI